MSYNHDHENEIIPFAAANFRNQQRRFGIKTDDRRRHVYILGKTGMGKTNLLENLIIRDIQAGHGCCYIDPHGDTAEKLLDFIPSSRINDVIYFNPSDMEFPIGFNVLEYVDESHKHLVGAGLMGVFKKIWPDVWSPRMEYIMNNCILALLDYPNSTLMGINRLLIDKEYRRRVISKLKDPVVKTFWADEYANWQEKFRTEAIAPIQNKVGQFLSTGLIRNIVAQVRSTIDPRKMMDEGKIFIVNLAKGRIGEDAMRLLGGLLVTKMQLAAMERVDMPEKDRLDFYLYVDEFQNFATESFGNILSEARKYRLNLIVAHQYINQLVTSSSTVVRDAIFGNVGTIISFRVGAADAEFLEPEFMPRFLQNDLVNLGKYDIYLRLMIDGVASVPFSATVLPPINDRTNSSDKVIKVSRERYTEPRAVVEDKIARWTGMLEDENPGGITQDSEAGITVQVKRDEQPPREFAPRDSAPRRFSEDRSPRRTFSEDRAPRERRPRFGAEAAPAFGAERRSQEYRPSATTENERPPMREERPVPSRQFRENRPQRQELSGLDRRPKPPVMPINKTEIVERRIEEKSISLSALKSSHKERGGEDGGGQNRKSSAPEDRANDTDSGPKKIQKGEVVKFNRF